MADQLTVEQRYRWRSLSYIRDVLGETSPLAASVNAFVREHGENLDRIPQVGQIVVYDSPPNGDMGLYVGANRVLRLDRDGVPRLLPLAMDHSRYLGAMWWPGREPSS